MAAEQLIRQSVQTNSTVYTDDAALHDDLLCASDDSAESDELIEYWGTTDAGDEWRIHVRLDVVAMNDLKIIDLCRAVELLAGHDGSGDIRTIVECALVDDPDVTAEDIAKIVREARADAALEVV